MRKSAELGWSIAIDRWRCGCAAGHVIGEAAAPADSNDLAAAQTA